MRAQVIERARSEVRTAEGAVAALSEVCDSLRADEADLRARLQQLHRSTAAAEEEAATAVAGRDSACQVYIRATLIFSYITELLSKSADNADKH